MSYQEWLKRQPDIAEAVETCPECGGCGYIICDHCRSSVYCEVCDGRGKVGPDTTAIYEYECLSEEMRYRRFFGIEIDHTMHEKYDKLRRKVRDPERINEMRAVTISVRL